MRKINWKKIFFFGLGFLWLGLLFYTRLLKLNWGLPYPMHPDERNMAESVQKLNCQFLDGGISLKNCFNPYFFAYGQLPLYFSYLLTLFLKFFNGNLGDPISFAEAVFSLRLIAAFASIINFFVIIKIIFLLKKRLSLNEYLFIAPLIIFSPFFIQFAHFGTTESLLMLLYSLLCYYSLVLINTVNRQKIRRLIFLLGFLVGLSVAVKVSSIIFFLPVFLTIFYTTKIKFGNFQKIFFQLFLFFSSAIFFAVIFSPHNFISFSDFIASFNYESAVATGKIKVFYTKQFDASIPIVFQLVKIFPFVFGYPLFFLSIVGIFFLNWDDKKINLLRIFFITYFLPTSFLYTKWTRFMAPIFPLMIIFAIFIALSIRSAVIKNHGQSPRFFVSLCAPPSAGNNYIASSTGKTRGFRSLEIKNKRQFLLYPLFIFGYLILVMPGIAFLTIFRSDDVRFTASRWIYKNIPAKSFILSETANVIDIPIQPPNYSSDLKNYRYVSFNFYNLDEDINLQNELNFYLKQANFIIIPSRRIFLNYYCPAEKNKWFTEVISGYFPGRCEKVRKEYPLLNHYYDNLFSNNLGFKELIKFYPYPKITLFGKTFFEFNDESAEETYTVFDHPVIRIFKRSY